MQIVFGLHLDGLKPEVPQTVVGASTLGPKGLLGVLETPARAADANPVSERSALQLSPVGTVNLTSPGQNEAS